MLKLLKEQKGFLRKHAWLWLILVWAGVLRFYKFSSIPFVADEFSALSRLKFSSFSDLINQGVLPDFHPAGTHVFLWVWGNTFGFDEWILKLPFALMGLLSIWMTYRIGESWFNRNTGVLAAAFTAVSQYFILYSQIARPYGMGLLFCLIALWYWKRLVFDGNLNKKAWLGWVLAATAVAYTHYFALLFLVLVGLSGLLFLKRRLFVSYLLAAVAICILYLPHFWIFFAQLSKGGVESWLAKPTLQFLTDYLGYLLHYDLYFAGALLIPAFLSVRRRKTPALNTIKVKLILLGISWWVACFLVGYLYSLYNSAILQFSGLLFALPFTLLAIIYALRFSDRLTNISALCILLLGTHSLIESRAHYFILYQSPYEQFVKHLKKVQDEYPNSLNLLAEEDHIYRYYAQRFALDTNQVVETIGQDLVDLKQLIDTSTASTLAMGLMYHAPKELVRYAQDQFPYLIEGRDYYQGSFYVFSKQPIKRAWQMQPYEKDSARTEDLGQLSPQNFRAGIEFTRLNQRIKHKHDLFTYAVETGATLEAPKVEMASAVMLRDSVVYWRTGKLLPKQADGSIHYYTFSIPEKWILKEGAYLKCFLWNMGSDTLQIKRAQLSLRKGNPFIYGLYEDFQ